MCVAGFPANPKRRIERGPPMLDTQNQGPQCTACGSPMKLTAIEPSTAGQDLRTFTCPECKRVERHLIESAVTEVWLEPKRTGVAHRARDGRLISKPAK
jgi:hypothetical protein